MKLEDITTTMHDFDLEAGHDYLDATAGNPVKNVNDRAKTCKAATLSAWIAFLSCAIIIFFAVISVVDSLIVNEKFWQQTEKFIQAYMDSRLCVLGNCTTLEMN